MPKVPQKKVPGTLYTYKVMHAIKIFHQHQLYVVWQALTGSKISIFLLGRRVN